LLNITSGFVFVDILAFRKSKSIFKNQISSTSVVNIINLWLITTSGLEKQTSTILEFYFRFRSRPSACRISSKSEHPLQKYDVIFIFKMAAATAKYYSSGFVFVDVTAFRMSKSISKPNFVDISQLTAEI